MKIMLTRPNAKIPTKEHLDDAGFDLYSPEKHFLEARVPAKIPLGIHITEFPKGTYGRIAPRSGLGVKGVQVNAGVVDASYQGEIIVVLVPTYDFEINVGDRIAQLILEKYEPDVQFELVENFDTTTSRGGDGFGSSGV